MKIQFDPEVDALYLQLLEGKAVDSENIEPNIVYDYDAKDQIIGIEVLRVGANLSDLATRALPFQHFDQQLKFLSFLETIADTELQAKLTFARQILQNQQVFLQSA
ncbi:DUF2283 domain-containing protein [Leptolyngbya cf. ectocarpi LEGE 11479]|uniref:DUF2283 domain-containing protein n=1 Tax=Leptolyngbya cf. ectocarpi LEGE 11479 TaxID=1828722 RepID=A0A929F9F8_LEPEC|nr:DUF2283 domain-containing protein [Leptolyngbya ectocarpi]MBE9067388.1 DUF2283 domain-containing protein [Leptolyngbya cf. ectocarpi LEGE 11479]